jgi:hypothetical protein
MIKPMKKVKRNYHNDNVKYKIVIEANKNGQSKLNAFNINQNLEGIKLIERELIMHLSLVQEQKIGYIVEAKTQPKIKLASANAMNIPRNLS